MSHTPTSNDIVSFIIPAHNRSDLLKQTLDSIVAQTDPDWEIRVVDDCSTDDTEEVALSYAASDSRIHYAKQAENLGACAARNRGFRESIGNLIVYMDSDDLIHASYVQRQREILRQNPDNDLSVVQMGHFTESPADMEFLWNTFQGNDPKERYLRHDPVWGIHGAMIRRSFLEKAEGFDEGLPLAQDYDFFTRLLLGGARPVLTNELLAYCRRHAGPSIGSIRELRRYNTLQQIFLRYLNDYPQNRQPLAENFLWLSSLGAAKGFRKAAMDNFRRGLQYIDGPRRGQVKSLKALTLLVAVNGRGKGYSLLRRRYREIGIDLDQRDAWHMSHRIADEAGLIVPKT